METDRIGPLRDAILACRKGGVVSVLGIYGLTDKFPMGVLMNKGLTLRTVQQHGQRYISSLSTTSSRATSTLDADHPRPLPRRGGARLRHVQEQN